MESLQTRRLGEKKNKKQKTTTSAWAIGLRKEPGTSSNNGLNGGFNYTEQTRSYKEPTCLLGRGELGLASSLITGFERENVGFVE